MRVSWGFSGRNWGNAKGRGVSRVGMSLGRVSKRNCKVGCRRITVTDQLVRLADIGTGDDVLVDPVFAVL
jgi:hypothetical protein